MFQPFLFPASADSTGRCEEQLYFYRANDYGVDGRHSAGRDNSKFSKRKMQVVPQNVFLPLEMYRNKVEGNYTHHIAEQSKLTRSHLWGLKLKVSAN